MDKKSFAGTECTHKSEVGEKMYLPNLKTHKNSRTTDIEFKGYNHNDYVSENEFYDMTNMCSDLYPVLSPREKRKKYNAGYTALNGIWSHNGRFCYVDADKFYYNGTQYGTVTNGPKKFVTMGAYIVIFPDKKLFNTESLQWGDLGATFSTIDDVHYAITTKEGDEYAISYVSATAPDEPQNGDFWIDTSDLPHVLKQYSSVSAMWVSVPTVYTKISSSGIGSRFSEYDGVKISGSIIPGFDGDYVIQGVGENYIIVIALLDQSITQATTLTVSRDVPDMDFVCELNNRIWGCSSENHEIYACKLGDPKNWYSYAGLSTDSYALTVGSDGDFTGCVSHLGYVLFFKENIIHKIYGTKPSNFQLTDTHARGVEKGSENSLCIVNETLYYKSIDGICRYDGSLPFNVSHALGKEKYKNAHAGTVGSKYYVSMQDYSNNYHLFAYDENYNLWHREDNTSAKSFVTVGNGLYFISSSEIMGINGIDELPGFTVSSEEDVIWSVQTGEIAYSTTDKKYLSRLSIRMRLDAGSFVKISVQYDNEDFEEVYTQTATLHKSYLIPIIPHRCDVVRIKIDGAGKCKIYAITKTIEIGSDI